MPKVSAIIPAYNCEKFIGLTIDSVLSQTYSDLELIVVDDGSTDNTASVINSINDKRIRYHYQPNSGLPAKGRNAGAKFSKGEYLAFLDHDDIWMPEKIEKQLAILKLDPKIALISTNGFLILENTKTEIPLIEDVKTGYFNDGNFFPNNNVILSSALINRSVYCEFGGFREFLDLKAVEDYDLWLRIYPNYPCYYLDDCLMYYRASVSSMSGGRLEIFERQLQHYNRYFLSYGFNDEINKLKLSNIVRALSYVQFSGGRSKWKDDLRKAYATGRKLKGFSRLVFFMLLLRRLISRIHKAASTFLFR